MSIKDAATMAFNVVKSTYPSHDWGREVGVCDDGSVVVFPGESANDGDSAVIVTPGGELQLLGSASVNLEVGEWALASWCPLHRRG
ncbi:hypothetical protein [Corynebacterium sp. NML130628]|uniref:hypothetical protein n=1 Tax=Corynebacterium sp. NML130628 TaxID=1906333 RepID=UPI0011600B2B|nr:hypothetical protein [Corynebacterium sp. NML130628]